MSHITTSAYILMLCHILLYITKYYCYVSLTIMFHPTNYVYELVDVSKEIQNPHKPVPETGNYVETSLKDKLDVEGGGSRNISYEIKLLACL